MFIITPKNPKPNSALLLSSHKTDQKWVWIGTRDLPKLVLDLPCLAEDSSSPETVGLDEFEKGTKEVRDGEIERKRKKEKLGGLPNHGFTAVCLRRRWTPPSCVAGGREREETKWKKRMKGGFCPMEREGSIVYMYFYFVYLNRLW